MKKTNVKTLVLMFTPALALIAFGALFSPPKKKSRLIVSKVSVHPSNFIRRNKYYSIPRNRHISDVWPDKSIKVLLQYNPSSLLDRFKNPEFTAFPDFKLIDEKGKAYYAGQQSVNHRIKHIKGNQYEVTYDFALYQVLRQMPSSSKQIWLKTQICFTDGWTLPILAIVYQRK